MFNDEGEKFLDHIVNSDENWISYSNIEMKKHSMVWKHSGSPKPKKFKKTFHGRKLMATFFSFGRGGDRKGVFLLVAFMNPGVTVTSEVYWEMLKQLNRVI